MTDEAIAERIVAALFESGFNFARVEHLVQNAADGRILGGWSRKGAADRVLAVLRESKPVALTPTERRALEKFLDNAEQVLADAGLAPPVEP